MIEKLTVLPSTDEDMTAGSPQKAALPRQVEFQGMVSHLLSKITEILWKVTSIEVQWGYCRDTCPVIVISLTKSINYTKLLGGLLSTINNSS